jgi:hypothetical protein
VNEEHEFPKRGRPPKVGTFPDNAPPVPETLDDAAKYFAWITNAVVTGQLDARSGHEAAFALKGFESAIAKRDLEREISKLRAELKAARASSETPVRGMGIARRA